MIGIDILICCKLLIKCKLRITFVHKSLINVTTGRIEVFGLLKLTHKNDRPNNAD